ncbi:MAG: hypothetical protein J6W96_06345 [Alphaproteobacteria bacterium]|nr:hypothetical protein [Alphaproteobacteria bacterium]
MKNYVIYRIGTLLVLPCEEIIAVHIIEARREETNRKDEEATVKGSPSTQRSQQGVKRNCGKAQRDARMRKKQRTKK